MCIRIDAAICEDCLYDGFWDTNANATFKAAEAKGQKFCMKKSGVRFSPPFVSFLVSFLLFLFLFLCLLFSFSHFLSFSPFPCFSLFSVCLFLCFSLSLSFSRSTHKFEQHSKSTAFRVDLTMPQRVYRLTITKRAHLCTPAAGELF